jgi:hypothetical protein
METDSNSTWNQFQSEYRSFIITRFHFSLFLCFHRSFTFSHPRARAPEMSREMIVIGKTMIALQTYVQALEPGQIAPYLDALMQRLMTLLTGVTNRTVQVWARSEKGTKGLAKNLAREKSVLKNNLQTPLSDLYLSASFTYIICLFVVNFPISFFVSTRALCHSHHFHRACITSRRLCRRFPRRRRRPRAARFCPISRPCSACCSLPWYVGDGNTRRSFVSFSTCVSNAW